MVNKAFKRSILKKHSVAKQERKNFKRCKYPYLKLWMNEPVNFTILTLSEWAFPLHIHEWFGGKPLKTPAICRVKQYGEKVCKYCDDKSGQYDNWSQLCKPYLVFVHNWLGAKFQKKGGGEGKKNPYVIAFIPEGKPDDEGRTSWSKIDKVADSKTFLKLLWQWRQKKTVRRITKESDINGLKTKGIVPKDVREDANELTEDEFIGHVLNCVAEAEHIQFGVEEIVIARDDKRKNDNDDDDDDKPSSKSKTKSKSRDEDEDEEDEEDDESDDDDSDDDDDDDSPKKKSPNKKALKKPPAKKKSKSKSDDDEDEDEESDDDEEEDDEEEDDEPKTKKKSSTKKVVKAKSSKKAHWGNHSKAKGDDDDETEDLDQDDEDDSEDEDDDKPSKKAKTKKTSKKPATKSRSKSKSRDDDDDEDSESDDDDESDDDE